MPSSFDNCAKRFCKGVFSSLVSRKIAATLPTSLSMPHATTTPSALPYVTKVDINTIFFCSCSSTGFSQYHSCDFSTASLSPVNRLSSTFRLRLSISLKSAGTRFPASNNTISPTTSSRASTSWIKPSRFTKAFGLVSSCRASIACSALYSCMTPISAFTITTATIIATSKYSFINRDNTAAANRINTIGSNNCSMNNCTIVGFFLLSNSFVPF